jgi:hypothetical protein
VDGIVVGAELEDKDFLPHPVTLKTPIIAKPTKVNIICFFHRSLTSFSCAIATPTLKLVKIISSSIELYQ